jgi:hypothetical protein
MAYRASGFHGDLLLVTLAVLMFRRCLNRLADEVRKDLGS